MNKYKICDKCKGFNYKDIINEIKKFDKEATFDIGCQNFCGIGRTKPFIIFNNIPIIANNEKELINELKHKLNKNN